MDHLPAFKTTHVTIHVPVCTPRSTFRASTKRWFPLKRKSESPWMGTSESPICYYGYHHGITQRNVGNSLSYLQRVLLTTKLSVMMTIPGFLTRIISSNANLKDRIPNFNQIPKTKPFSTMRRPHRTPHILCKTNYEFCRTEKIKLVSFFEDHFHELPQTPRTPAHIYPATQTLSPKQFHAHKLESYKDHGYA